MSRGIPNYIGKPKWGHIPNDKADKYERRRMVLRDHQRDIDFKEHNRRTAWATIRGRIKPLSKHQRMAGAHRVV